MQNIKSFITTGIASVQSFKIHSRIMTRELGAVKANNFILYFFGICKYSK